MVALKDGAVGRWGPTGLIHSILDSFIHPHYPLRAQKLRAPSSKASREERTSEPTDDSSTTHSTRLINQRMDGAIPMMEEAVSVPSVAAATAAEMATPRPARREDDRSTRPKEGAARLVAPGDSQQETPRGATTCSSSKEHRLGPGGRGVETSSRSTSSGKASTLQTSELSNVRSAGMSDVPCVTTEKERKKLLGHTSSESSGGTMNNNDATAVCGGETNKEDVKDQELDANTGSNDNHRHFSASISCPGGGAVELTSAVTKDSATEGQTVMILGRGRNGISHESVHVSRSACVIRIVKKMDSTATSAITGHGVVDDAHPTTYGLELVVVGSQPCRITRAVQATNAVGDNTNSNTTTATTTASIQVSSPLVQNDCGPTFCQLLDGDVVEPYLREGGVTASQSEFERAGKYFPFVVSIADTATRGEVGTPPGGAAFVEASRRIMREEKRMVAESQDTVGALDEEKISQDKKKHAEANVDIEEKSATGVNSASGGATKGADAEDGPTAGASMDLEVKESTEPNLEAVTAATATAAIAHEATEPSLSEPKDVEMLDTATTRNVLQDSTVPTASAEQSTAKPVVAPPAAHNATDLFSVKADDVDKSDATKEEVASTVAKAEKATEPSKEEASQGSTQSSSSSEQEESSEDDYDIDNPREELLEILQGVDSPGSFATGGSCGTNLIMPGITIDGIGTVGLPLSEAQARILAARFEQAPFGRGSETIVDKSVRNTFQLDPEHFMITNPRWESEISGLLSNVRRDLGVQSHLEVEAQLYKMLLYEEGSFFAMHRDSEKVDGMFGTLVVVLPTAFTGGELVVKHQGQMKQFAQSHSSGFGSQYAAFYADCKHELKPVTSGHRLCLVYNLVKTGSGACPRAQRNRQILKRLKHAVGAWAESFDGHKLVIMTEHMYTPAGISGGGSSEKFKGNDAAVVHLLEQAVEEGIDVDWDHGTVSYSESGYGEGDESRPGMVAR